MRQILSGAEIATVRGTTAYDAVKRLRPEYLRTTSLRRLGPQPQAPVVYIANALAGGTEALSGIPIGTIAQIRYVTPDEAFGRYGAGYGGGMIIVRLRQ
jgi:hypothetical protein